MIIDDIWQTFHSSHCESCKMPAVPQAGAVPAARRLAGGTAGPRRCCAAASGGSPGSAAPACSFGRVNSRSWSLKPARIEVNSHASSPLLLHISSLTSLTRGAQRLRLQQTLPCSRHSWTSISCTCARQAATHRRSWAGAAAAPGGRPGRGWCGAGRRGAPTGPPASGRRPPPRPSG